MKQNHRMNAYKSVQQELFVYLVQTDQAELINQMPQHNGMLLRRDALGAIDLSRKSMQPRRRKELSLIHI